MSILQQTLYSSLVLTLMACGDAGYTPSNPWHGHTTSALTKSEIIVLAQSIIDAHNSPTIWSLGTIDTTRFTMMEDHFVDSAHTNRIALIGAEAGLSSGTTDHLLIVFSPTPPWNILWAGQVGQLQTQDIEDLNGDGIDEVKLTSYAESMGECREDYEIVNFKHGQYNSIIREQSFSTIDCGASDAWHHYQWGDTIAHTSHCLPLKTTSKGYLIQIIRSTQVFRGGDNKVAVLKNAEIRNDTLYEAL